MTIDNIQKRINEIKTVAVEQGSENAHALETKKRFVNRRKFFSLVAGLTGAGAVAKYFTPKQNSFSFGSVTLSPEFRWASIRSLGYKLYAIEAYNSDGTVWQCVDGKWTCSKPKKES